MMMLRALILVVSLALASIAMPLRAEFVLDDFDDPAEVLLPEDANVRDAAETEGVGPLNARRSVAGFSDSAFPTGRLFIDETTDSALRMELEQMELDGEPSFFFGSFATSYAFEQQNDLTEEGTNNALLFDFRSFNSPVVPTYIRTTIRSADGSPFDVFDRDLPPLNSDEPFTYAVLLKDFLPRGGQPRPSDFTAASLISWSIRFDRVNTPGSSEPLEVGAVVELDRIRLGKVPEPSTLAIMLVAVIPVARLA